MITVFNGGSVEALDYVPFGSDGPGAQGFNSAAAVSSENSLPNFITDPGDWFGIAQVSAGGFG